MKVRHLFVLSILSTSFSSLVIAQPGTVTFPAVPIVTTLNPNGDAWTTSCNCAYFIDDQTESEVNWEIIQPFEGEPTGDLSPGGPCASTDIVDNFTFNGAGYKHLEDPDAIPDNGDETFLFRLRVGTDPGAANFGFSVFFDLDLLYATGAAACPNPDPDFVVGNPGFEMEIRAKNQGGGKGVYLDDISLFPVVTNVGFYAMGNNIQRNDALYGNFCGSPAFYDLSVPFIDITTNFGVLSTTPLRMGVATTVAGASALPNAAVDVGGIDDNNYATDDLAWIDLICNQTPITLGVDYLNFTATLNSNDEVELVWSTATEINNEYFTVERSQDGENFQKVTTVNAVGTSSTPNSYDAMDYNPLSGVSYYRIKQTDINGDFTYSKMAHINRNQGLHIISTYPNPAENEIHLMLGSWEDRNAVLEIVNPMGQTVKDQTIELNKGSNQLHMDVSSLSNGIYILKISSEDGNFQAQKQIVKLSK